MLFLIISNSSSPSLFFVSSSSSMPSSKMSITSKPDNDDDDDDGGAVSTTSQSKLITSSPSRKARRTKPILGNLQYVLSRQVCPPRSILAGNRDEDDVFLRCIISSAKIHEDLTRAISLAGLQILLSGKMFSVSMPIHSRMLLGDPPVSVRCPDALFTILSDKIHSSHMETWSVVPATGTENRFRSSHPIVTLSSTVLRGISATSIGAMTDLTRVSEELTARRRFRRSMNDECLAISSRRIARSQARLRAKYEATSTLETQQVRRSSAAILALQRSASAPRMLFRSTRSLRATLPIVVLVASTIPEIGCSRAHSLPFGRPLPSIDAIKNRRSRSAAALSAIAPLVALDPTTIAAVAVVLSSSSLFTLTLSRVVSLRGIIKSLPIARDTVSWPVSRRLLIIGAREGWILFNYLFSNKYTRYISLKDQSSSIDILDAVNSS